LNVRKTEGIIDGSDVGLTEEQLEGIINRWFQRDGISDGNVDKIR